jgi:hypothetical protein
MKYNLEHIKAFVGYIKDNAPVETTNKYLRETFFNNNKETSASVFKIVKEAGILMTDKSWCKGKGQTWYYLNNNIDIDILFKTNTSVKKKKDITMVNNDEEIIEFKYRGIYTVKEVISKADKKDSIQIRVDLGSDFSEHFFGLRAANLGWSKEKTWFMFNKIVRYMPLDTLLD